jgi:hypothetical protein
MCADFGRNMRSSISPHRQGCYSKEGDIVVLCAYLGQLARLRDALSKEVAVVVDERDEEKLAAQEDDSEAKVDANITQTVERVQVSRRVCLSWLGLILVS